MTLRDTPPLRRYYTEYRRPFDIYDTHLPPPFDADGCAFTAFIRFASSLSSC